METILLLVNPGSNRARFVEEAARAAGVATQVVAWERLLREHEDAWNKLRDVDDSILRIESPGRDALVEMLLLKWGSDALASADESAEQLWDAAQLQSRLPDKGLIVPMHQWYAGWTRLLKRVKATAPRACFSHDADEVLAMFDKARTHSMLREAGVPVAPSLGTITSWDELMHKMREAAWSRIFLKPLHGSSASGVIALETHGSDMQAFAPVEMLRADDGHLRLYNSRHVQRMRDIAAIRELVDALGVAGLHTERWMPKMGFAKRRCDLRVVVIGGRARHVVVRLSPHPMTNLHLGGTRGDAGLLRASICEEAWCRALEVCERAASVFPRSITVGVDLLLAPGGRDPRVLEVNAFGGLLPGELLDGWDTYRWEMEEMLRPGSTTSLQVSSTGA
jgi:hypothetical protein